MLERHPLGGQHVAAHAGGGGHHDERVVRPGRGERGHDPAGSRWRGSPPAAASPGWARCWPARRSSAGHWPAARPAGPVRPGRCRAAGEGEGGGQHGSHRGGRRQRGEPGRPAPPAARQPRRAPPSSGSRSGGTSVREMSSAVSRRARRTRSSSVFMTVPPACGPARPGPGARWTGRCSARSPSPRRSPVRAGPGRSGAPAPHAAAGAAAGAPAGPSGAVPRTAQRTPRKRTGSAASASPAAAVTAGARP